MRILGVVVRVVNGVADALLVVCLDGFVTRDEGVEHHAVAAVHVDSCTVHCDVLTHTATVHHEVDVLCVDASAVAHLVVHFLAVSINSELGACLASHDGQTVEHHAVVVVFLVCFICGIDNVVDVFLVGRILYVAREDGEVCKLPRFEDAVVVGIGELRLVVAVGEYLLYGLDVRSRRL